MRDPQRVTSATQAMNMLIAALGYLATLDAASLPTATQAEALKCLERAESRHTVARSRILAAFSAQRGPEDDGLGSARMWLTFHTRTTKHAARGSVAWMRRLRTHPVIEEALVAGELSCSWARQFCEWTERLPTDSARPRTGSCAGPQHAARNWVISRAWPCRCMSGPVNPIRTGTAGSLTGGSGSTPPSVARAGSTETSPRLRCRTRCGAAAG